MNNENNKFQIDIDNLFKQNVNDLTSIKELYRKLEEIEKKITQIKYIDINLANKLKKEYEKLKKDYESLKKAISEDYESLKCVILDENVQAKLANDINKINSQLDTMDNEIYKRKLKPLLFQNVWSRNEKDNNGLYTVSFSKELTKQAIKAYKYAGVDGLTFVIHIGYDASKNKLYSECNKDTIDYIISECLANGMKLSYFKFHQDFSVENVLNIGIEEFKRQYKLLINDYLNSYKQHFEYVGLFNEFRYFYMDNGFTINEVTYDFTDFVVECLNSAKNYGYKASVSLAGVDSGCWSSIDELSIKVKNVCDVYMINYYQPIGYKLEKTTYNDSLIAHQNSQLNKLSESLLMDKKIIITETGLNDSYECLYAPGYYLTNGTSSNGKVTLLYLYGLLETFNKDNILSINYWYTDPILYNKEKVKEFLSSYIGGVKNV